MWDYFLQTTHQTQCHRIVLYHCDKDLHVFPAQGYGEEAVEVGPCSNSWGPCIVMLKNVDVCPESFQAWFEDSLLRRHCTRLYWFQAGQTRANGQDALISAITALGAPAGSVRLHCHPRLLDKVLAEQLPADWQLHPKHFNHVLSVVELEEQYLIQLHEGTLYRLDSLEPRSFPGSCSRAVNKLQEALHVLGIMTANLALAIDLGAAPGGWTGLLADFSKKMGSSQTSVFLT
ncbi:hypothetical protein WJX72_007018 [[Myrmecia] bisecta]|uniref:Ribosomal RNA methyltransferase FtsJ domain-containing protein n=1 Tax=[Myrmecia] bisecta TaxID=41462 RepID=A0AAW1PQ34_9CHLO